MNYDSHLLHRFKQSQALRQHLRNIHPIRFQHRVKVLVGIPKRQTVSAFHVGKRQQQLFARLVNLCRVQRLVVGSMYQLVLRIMQDPFLRQHTHRPI